jgi:hypothetical protein
MAVNLVTRIRNFVISNQTLPGNDHDVQGESGAPGRHRIMRFDSLSDNAGSSDLVICSPASRPDPFVWSAGHGRYHYQLHDFSKFLLFNVNGALATTGYEEAFCALDTQRIGRNASSAAAFADCNTDQRSGPAGLAATVALTTHSGIKWSEPTRPIGSRL